MNHYVNTYATIHDPYGRIVDITESAGQKLVVPAPRRDTAFAQDVGDLPYAPEPSFYKLEFEATTNRYGHREYHPTEETEHHRWGLA